MTERSCSNCAYSIRDDICDSLICGNADCELYTDWMEDDDVCGDWEENNAGTTRR